jgi:hypothetical protein
MQRKGVTRKAGKLARYKPKSLRLVALRAFGLLALAFELSISRL